ncbi:MAG TPA: ATP-grasp domain-containing protein [Aestuariivirgaceae bacterium]|nr:ATP-grasp domain-containing protein [Aestuariivirgaceae bacterium]
MNFEEHAGKRLLAEAGIAVPPAELVTTPAGAEAAARRIGACVVKAQIPAGKRGKAGGILSADDPRQARDCAEAILAMTIAGHRVERVLVEARIDVSRELYAAIVSDPASQGPLLLFSTVGGMDVEDMAEHHPGGMHQHPISILEGLLSADAEAVAAGAGDAASAVAEVLVKLYDAYRRLDAELVEINPLAITRDGGVVALDCKLVVDDAAASRQASIVASGAPEPLTDLERRAREAGLKYIELAGSVGILANGAGLTMTTMDAVSHCGGAPANFLEIGGEAYTKAHTALEILLSSPNIKSVLVNFCGAFARTDVMADGVVSAWKALDPALPIFFTIHGTGEDEAVALVRRELGIEPFEHMDDAVRAAVEAAGHAV